MYHIIRNILIITSLCASTVLAGAPASPGPGNSVSSLSRFGSPKYPPDFTAFSYVNANAPKGGKLKMGSTGNFDTLNEYVAKGIAAFSLSLTVDPLMRRATDEPFTLYALIAEKVDLSPDNSAITFHINPAARFHDGTPITAEDVKFSYEMLMEYGLPRYRNLYSKIEKIEILDPRTIKLTFQKTEKGYDPEIPMITALLKVFSKAQYEGKDFRETGMKPLLGSGPYRVAKAEQGRYIVYERVKDYWAADLPINRGMFNFDSIQIDYYKNAQAFFQAFKAGEFDAFFEVDPQQWRNGYNVPAIETGKMKKVAMKIRRPVAIRVAIFNMRRPLFQDIRIREAIGYALDWETMNKMVFNGDYQRVRSLFANTHLEHKGAAKGLELKMLEPYLNTIPKKILEEGYTPPTTKGDGDARANLDAADKLLVEAGWIIEKKKNPVTQQVTFCRVHKDTKQPLEFEFMYKDPRLEKILNLFRQNLQRLGITLNVRFMDTVQYEARVLDTDWDMIAHTWANGWSPGNEQVYYFSQHTADQRGSSNYIGMKDPVAEALANTVANAQTKEELIAAVHALDRVVMGRHYMVPMFYDDNLYWAYWADRVEFPKFDPVVGTNAIEWWWAKPARAESPDLAIKDQDQQPSMFRRILTWFKSLWG